ncbi:MAG: hypothetical protein JWM05_3786 [Acidimicrobiales bacterium]|nr:hypothetical protein [Acidimicrobiales bacterium]
MANAGTPSRGSARAVVVPLVAVLVVGLIAAAYLLWPRPRQRVVVLGDSITVLTRPELERKAHSYKLAIGAVSGVRVEQMVGPAKDMAKLRPRQLIINLGTNNVTGRDDPTAIITRIGEIIQQFDSAECIHLVTVNAAIVRLDDAGLPDRIRRVNDGIQLLAAQHKDRIDVIDWSAQVGKYLQAKSPRGLVLSDTVHPTKLGQVMLADDYVRALKSCRRR